MLVTALQVLEHLADIMPFVEAAYRCVKPGGLLVLSVPNRERRKEPGFGSLDHPPHHLSRWSERQCHLVAEKLAAEMVCVVKEPLARAQTIAALRHEEMQRVLPFDFPGRVFAIKVLSRLLLTFPMSLLWRAFGLSHHLGMYGMSIVVVCRKPSPIPDCVIGHGNRPQYGIPD